MTGKRNRAFSFDKSHGHIPMSITNRLTEATMRRTLFCVDDLGFSTWESPEPHKDLTTRDWFWSANDKVKRWNGHVKSGLQARARHSDRFGRNYFAAPFQILISCKLQVMRRLPSLEKAPPITG